MTTRAPSSRPPPPPFGLSAWVDDGEATVVELDGSADLSRAEDVAEQIPDSRSFLERTLVVVLAKPAVPSGAWRRLVSLGGIGGQRASRAARCSALVMRGYVDVEAAIDVATSADLAWGWSSREG